MRSKRARRTRWPQLLTQYEGRIDAETGQTILGDTFDVYLMRIEPSSRTISSHYDTDPQPFVLLVRSRTVANVDSMGLVDRICFQCFRGKAKNENRSS